MKGKKKALIFNRVTIFTVSLSIVLIVSVVLIALIAVKRALERTDVFLEYNIAARSKMPHSIDFVDY